MSIVTCPNCGAKNRIDESRRARQKPICGRCKQELPITATANPIDLTDANFASVLSSAGDKPVLVDCWAPWCGPCRMIAPTIKQLANESAGRWIIAKLNTDENPQTAGQFNISAIPTMLIFKNGAKVDQLIGLQPRAAIEKRLEMHRSNS
jgi:thioredoxin